MVTGTSVVAVTYADGVMMAADTLGETQVHTHSLSHTLTAHIVKKTRYKLTLRLMNNY